MNYAKKLASPHFLPSHRPSITFALPFFFVWFIIKFLLEKVILINDKTNRDHGYAGGVGKGLDIHCIEKSALMS